MAYKNFSSLLARIFILSILLAIAGQALAGRGNPKVARSEDMKQPAWLLSDHSLLIPGIGRVLLPPGFGTPPYTGSNGGTGASGGHIPGGDDTFVPSPDTGGGIPPPGN